MCSAKAGSGFAGGVADGGQEQRQRDEALLAVDHQRVADRVRFGCSSASRTIEPRKCEFERLELVQLEDVVEQRVPLVSAPAVGALEVGNDVLLRPVEQRPEAHLLGLHRGASGQLAYAATLLLQARASRRGRLLRAVPSRSL